MTNLADTTLADIIARGQAAYRATLPEYDAELMAALDRADVEPTAPNNIGIVTEARQIELCLACPHSDCLTIASPACPIRVEMRAAWRRARTHSRREVTNQ